jgi:hypothetical protein
LDGSDNKTLTFGEDGCVPDLSQSQDVSSALQSWRSALECTVHKFTGFYHHELLGDVNQYADLLAKKCEVDLLEASMKLTSAVQDWQKCGGDGPENATEECKILSTVNDAINRIHTLGVLHLSPSDEKYRLYPFQMIPLCNKLIAMLTKCMKSRGPLLAQPAQQRFDEMLLEVLHPDRFDSTCFIFEDAQPASPGYFSMVAAPKYDIGKRKNEFIAIVNSACSSPQALAKIEFTAALDTCRHALVSLAKSLASCDTGAKAEAAFDDVRTLCDQSEETDDEDLYMEIQDKLKNIFSTHSEACKLDSGFCAKAIACWESAQKMKTALESLNHADGITDKSEIEDRMEKFYSRATTALAELVVLR